MSDSDRVIQSQNNEGEESANLLFHSSPATRLRLQITPYLPPPVVVAIKTLDPKLEPLLGPEASITLLGTALIGLLLWKVLSIIFGGSSSAKRGAIQDEEEDDAIVDYKDISYDGTVLFCGPSLAGKTSLFYSLVYPTNIYPVRTVSTLKPNTGFVSQQDSTWRYLDTPGHWSPSKLVSTVIIPSTRIERIVLVLDSTQSVSKAADYLYELLRQYQGTILVACHKAKEPKAKNVRRLKLQLRTELERLSKLDNSSSASSSSIQQSDWEHILSKQVVLVSTSVDPPLLQELREYLETGKVSQTSS